MKSNLWQLDMPSEEVKKAYLDKFLDKLSKRIIKSRFSKGFKSILIPHYGTNEEDLSILSRLLIEEPRELKNLNHDLEKQIHRLSSYPSTDKIEKLFNYSGFISQDKENSYWLAKKIQRNTCVYCNRLYIFTVEGIKENGKTKHITRPEFDHWFPKSKYPLLSMSLMNLIPSCHICNSSLKKDDEFNIKKYIHPYIHEGKEPLIKFRISRTAGNNSDWTVKLDYGNNEKVENTMKAFALKDIYGYHKDLEIQEMVKFHDAYPQGYIDTLFEDILKKGENKLSRAEIYRFFFGTEMKSDKFLDRPLSKMKYDILKDLELINDNEEPNQQDSDDNR